jgi:hypothetical protein
VISPQPGRVSLIAANTKATWCSAGRVPDAALASTAPPTSTPAAPVAAAPQRLVFDATSRQSRVAALGRGRRYWRRDRFGDPDTHQCRT